MLHTIFRFSAAVATSRQIAALLGGVLPIQPTMLDPSVYGAAALASLHQCAATGSFETPISLMQAEQTLAGIEPILQRHRLAAVEFS
jgi:hypothetical protein